MLPRRPSPAHKSFFRLLLNLTLTLVQLLLPLALATAAPTTWTVCVMAIMLIAIGATAKTGRRTSALHISRWLTGVILGLACRMLLVFPAYWNIAVCLLVILAGFSMQASYERRLRLSPASRNGGGQDRNEWPAMTPEGQSIRQLGSLGEIAMGGPAYGDFLFPDGVVLQGVGAGARFSRDGRYFAAALPSRQRFGLLVLDRLAHRLHHGSDDPAFWDIDEFSGTTAREAGVPSGQDTPLSAGLSQFLAGANVVDLQPVRDLWIAPGPWQERISVPTREFPAPDGSLALTAHLQIPDTLQALQDPLAPLYDPRYRLRINGQDTPLLITGQTPVAWREDGQALAIQADSLDGDPGKSGFWLWQSDAGWRQLPAPWQPGENEPSLTWYDPCALDGHALQIEAKLDFPGLSSQSHGDQLYSIHSDMQVLIGHAPDGRMILGECPRTSLRLSLPLDSRGERGETDVSSALLACGLRARLQWLRDGRNGLGAYRCHIGTWELPGEWLLDHRVSDDGRSLALISFADAPQAPGQLVLADTDQRRLLAGPSLLFMRLQDFRAGRISLIEIVGRLEKETPHAPAFGTALRRFQEPAPSPTQAAAFLAPRENSRLCFQLRYAVHTTHGLSLLPSWRIVDQPQAANADGDFVLPAPGLADAAWLFGAQTDYGSSSPMPDEPRQDGYLLTATGCALSGLGPAMIWSHDGRYLALTRILPERGSNGQRLWQLLLLEPGAGSLRIRTQPLGCMPLFEYFDDAGLSLRVFDQSWHVQGDTGKPLFLSQQELADLPATALIQATGLCLQKDQLDTVNDWLALDTSAVFSCVQPKPASQTPRPPH